MEKPQKRLYRSITDRKIAGVCGGLATYFNIDSTIIRLLWIAGMIATGVLPGAFIYLIAALIIPKEPKKV
jgi:phage shock protein PspC (stress-responsive transcriptional regulator)